MSEKAKEAAIAKLYYLVEHKFDKYCGENENALENIRSIVKKYELETDKELLEQVYDRLIKLNCFDQAEAFAEYYQL